MQRVLLVGGQRLRPDLEARVASRCPSPCRGPGRRRRRGRSSLIWSRTVESDVGFGVLNVIWVPPLKSMPRFRPLTPITTTLTTIATVAIERKSTAALRAVDVDLLPLRDRLARRAHEPRVVEPAEAGEQAEHRARRGDRRDQREHGAEQQHQGEALDLRGRDGEQHERGDHGDDVRVEDRVEALLVAAARSPRGWTSRTAPLP